uniref:EOG090X0KP6 n=1 Tax=Alona affinis TaxID=381656 RepID=A0A9N6WWT9_9CRUS|nr:EOG090X0KP6 [Alona affinis]
MKMGTKIAIVRVEDEQQQTNPHEFEDDLEVAGQQDVDKPTASAASPAGTVVQQLTSFQRAKMERNRQQALLLRQARLQAHPYKNTNRDEAQSVIRVQNSRLIDSGGGFLIDEKDLEEEQSREVVVTEVPAPIIVSDRPHCEECQQPICDSFLYRSFLHPVCDSCKDEEGEHMLITRTDARQEYLLKECDLDLREPTLKFILRKNPHNPRWGDMKLYLRSQVGKFNGPQPNIAIIIWETPEKLEEERESREQKREKSKVKKFNKQVKSNVYTKQTAGHQHTYGDETYDADRDVYFRTCTSCTHRQEYEKM